MTKKVLWLLRPIYSGKRRVAVQEGRLRDSLDIGGRVGGEGDGGEGDGRVGGEGDGDEIDGGKGEDKDGGGNKEAC